MPFRVKRICHYSGAIIYEGRRRNISDFNKLRRNVNFMRKVDITRIDLMKSDAPDHPTPPKRAAGRHGRKGRNRDIRPAWLGAVALAIGMMFCPQDSTAQGFTGTDFAEWSEEEQDGYIQTSVTMVGVVMTQIRPEVSRCIDGWYWGDGRKAERNAFIRETITGHAVDYHPAGTILAILIDQCGPLQ